jgi:hypothetical protein
MSFLSKNSLVDPMKSLQYRTFLSTRMESRQTQATITSMLWMDPKFHKWNSSLSPSIIYLKGDYTNRLEVQRFAIGIIDMLRREKVAVLWALKSISTHGASAMSSIDVIKELVCQALQLNVALHTEKSLALSCAQFRAADTPELWFDLLARVIQTFPILYIVVDLQAVGSPYSQDISWLSQLSGMFDRHTLPKHTSRLKILLVSYGKTTMSAGELTQFRDSIVVTRRSPTKLAFMSSGTRLTPRGLKAMRFNRSAASP